MRRLFAFLHPACLAMAGLLVLLLVGPVPAHAAGSPALRVIAGDSNPPYNFEENGRARGVAVELVQEMLRRAALDVPIEIYPWPRALALARRTPNTLLFCITRSPGREADFLWIEPIYDREIWLWRLAGRHDIRAASLQEARRYTVAVSLADIAAEWLQRAGFVEGRNLDTTPRPLDIPRKMQVGRVDLVPGTAQAIDSLAERAGMAPGSFEKVVLLTQGAGVYLALQAETDPALVARLRHVLQGMKADGSFQRILAPALGARRASR